MIYLFYEACSPLLEAHEEKAIKSTQLIEKEGFTKGDLNIIFCSDEYLLSINQKHLNHDFYTDIITFSYNSENVISGDLFISIDRAKENSEKNGVSYVSETSRLVIHGLLHLCGYNDKDKKDVIIMRDKERKYLEMIGFT